MKVLVVFGTRPEAIKMCPLVLELQKNKKIICRLCVTGQHKEMVEPVLGLFHIVPDYRLNIMKPNQTLSMITTAVIDSLDDVLVKEQPDFVLVHGDTSSSFAAAVAAFYRQIPVGHVEAGLRTYNMHSPFPEEFNRQAIDLISKFYFAPTETAKRQLLKEGKDEAKIYVTGNTVIDALRTTFSLDYQNEHIQWAEGSRIILLTAHRRENIGQSMQNIFRAVRRIAMEYDDVKIIYPIHKNPNVRNIANSFLRGIHNIRLIEPIDVYYFHNFMGRSYLILTDSGGIQEEAPSFGKPVLVLRKETERPEGVEAGTLKLVGTDTEAIYSATKKLLDDPQAYEKMSRTANPYGDGTASKQIVKAILKHFEER